LPILSVYLFAQSDFINRIFLEDLYFYFMKTASRYHYGNIAVYGHIAVSVFKIYYTLRCSLEYICSVCSPLRRHGPLIVKTLTHVL